MTHRLAFVGCGNMARNMIAGLIGSGYDSRAIVVSNRSRGNLQTTAKQFDIKTADSNCDAVNQADVVVLAVKPQQIRAVCDDIRPGIRSGQLVFSIAAGIELNSLEAWLPQASVVRVMPNVNVATGAGVIGLYARDRFQHQDKVTSMLRSLGECFWVDQESQLRAMTILSASGVALYCYFSEALQSAAERLGLSQEIADKAIRQTMLGTAQGVSHDAMLSWSQLRQQVTSPGGTTEAALAQWDKLQLSEGVQQAVDCAIEKVIAMSSASGGEQK